jgi:hypothetical protein
MPKIVSSIGSREFPAGPGMRKFTVEDPTMSDDDFDNPSGRLRRHQQQEAQPKGPALEDYTREEIMDARRRKMDEINRVSEPARQRTEILIGIGRATKNIEVVSGNESVTFSIRTLKGREIKQLMRYVGSLSSTGSNITTSEASIVARDIILAWSIYAIDGVNFDLFLNISNQANEDEILSDKLEFIENLDESLIGHIYSEYGILTKNNASRFSIKDEADAKEVSESIHKSGEGAKP